MEEPVKRKWGQYQVLSCNGIYKIKELIINPMCGISHQLHYKRAEHWYILSGLAQVTLGSRVFNVTKGYNIDIPMKEKHRICNIGKEPVHLIEIQTGSYFGEDDIKRFS